MVYSFFIQSFLKKYEAIQDKALLFQYLREELQYLLLRILFTKQKYPVIFMGGTQLRLSHGMNRFSEDIDLSLEHPDKNFPTDDFFSSITAPFLEKRSGFQVNMRTSYKTNVAKGIITFSHILYDLNISPLKDETLKIKMEVDTNPPQQALYETKRYESLFGDYMLQVFDGATNFAGKLSAIVQRKYQKGRDYYDLQWYLRRKPAVGINISYLNASMAQQHGKPFQNKAEIIHAVIQKVEHLDHAVLKRDLERFVIMDTSSFEDWIQQYIPETVALLKSYQASL